MSFLKSFWAFSFQKKEAVKNLVITVVIYIVASVVVGFILGLLGKIPLIGTIFNLLSYIFSLYCTAGVVFTFLNYFKVGPFKTEE